MLTNVAVFRGRGFRRANYAGSFARHFRGSNLRPGAAPLGSNLLAGVFAPWRISGVRASVDNGWEPFRADLANKIGVNHALPRLHRR
jgi:hypothetical protein